MMNKTIEFNYDGGQYVQKLSIRGENLPWKYECTADWINITSGTTVLNIFVGTTYDFRQREADINIFDKYLNKLTIHVIQKGYTGLKVECPSMVVLCNSYYESSDVFKAYLTIYGGNRQEPSCNALKPYITKIWDNSSLYNDFVIRIPKEFSGNFIIEHMDARQYRKYCKENNIPYNNSDLRKELTIKQFTEDDIIGEMLISIDGVTYSSNDNKPIEIEINTNEYKEIKILSTKYVHIISNTEYEEINKKNVDITKMACWVSCVNKPGMILVKSYEENMLSDRQCIGKIVNVDNPYQFIDLIIKQKVSN